MSNSQVFGRRCLGLTAAVIVLMGGMAQGLFAQRPSATRLLPDTTVAVISMPDSNELAERFMNGHEKLIPVI